MRVRALVVAAVAALTFSAPAWATFPGKDGRLLYDRFDESTFTFALFSAALPGVDELQLTHWGPGISSVFGDWSPDGSLIAFDSDQGIESPVTYVMNADGTGVRQLTAEAFSADPGWSPDGTRIAVEADWGDYPALEGIWTFPYRASGLVGQGDAVRLTVIPPGVFADSEPQYSPDGRWIAFTRYRDIRHTAIFRVRTDGSVLERLTEWKDNASAPDWSPDGSTIAYDTNDARRAPSQGHVMVMDADGSNQRILIQGTDVDYLQNPVFSPSGKKIAYARFPVPHGPPELWTARSDGTHRRMVTVAPGTNKPDWGAR
jgi:TolB protein